MICFDQINDYLPIGVSIYQPSLFLLVLFYSHLSEHSKNTTNNNNLHCNQDLINLTWKNVTMATSPFCYLTEKSLSILLHL